VGACGLLAFAVVDGELCEWEWVLPEFQATQPASAGSSRERARRQRRGRIGVHHLRFGRRLLHGGGVRGESMISTTERVEAAEGSASLNCRYRECDNCQHESAWNRDDGRSS
jgi:hypothetical protein